MPEILSSRGIKGTTGIDRENNQNEHLIYPPNNLFDIYKFPLIQYPLIYNALTEQLKSIRDFKVFKRKVFNYQLNKIV